MADKREIKPLSIFPVPLTCNQLVEKMHQTGVLGAGRVGRAKKIIAEMFSDPDYTVFTTMAGPVVPSGLGKMVSDLIGRRLVDVIVTTGANIVHDILEGLGMHHYYESEQERKGESLEEDYGQVAEILVPMRHFELLEKWLHKTLKELQSTKTTQEEGLSTTKLLWKLGEKLDSDSSILTAAAHNNVPIFCPTILDSMMGLHLWTFSQLDKLRLDFLEDLSELANIIFEAKKTGAIILGGGSPKHFCMGANTLRDGLDAAVQITLDRPEAGSSSGAKLEEGVSWHKIKPNPEKFVTVIGDFTAIFPLIIAAVLESFK